MFDKKTETVSIRLTDTEKECFRQAAEAADMTLSQLIRELLREYCEKNNQISAIVKEV